MKKRLATIILTYNEEIHIERCINSIKNISDEIYIIDSYSTDKTIEISEKMGAKTLQNKWENNLAKQLNWGIKNINTKCEWILRLDADEYLTKELLEEIESKISEIPEEVTGIEIGFKINFMGKIINHGNNYPIKKIRMWRNGYGYCKNIWMDEYIIVDTGKISYMDNIFIDHNLKNITWWTEKHNKYAIREMKDTLIRKYHLLPLQNKNIDMGIKEKIKGILKKTYHNLPLFMRPILYFNYRYFIKLGFLDGKEGLIWNLLQGFWYRFLVDVKVYEFEKKLNFNRKQIKEKIRKEFL